MEKYRSVGIHFQKYLRYCLTFETKLKIPENYCFFGIFASLNIVSYSAFVLFEESNFIDWIILLYTITDRNIAFLVPFSYVLHVELWESSCKSVHFLLTNISKGAIIG